MVCWILAFFTILVLRKNELQNDRLLSFGLPGLFVLCSFGLTLATILQDQLGLSGLSDFFHNLVQAFNPDQYSLPIYAALVLLAMALLFLASVWVLRQKAPLAVALIAFATIPGYSALMHWSHSEQRDHWFGYWFGHDMFTPPFNVYPEMPGMRFYSAAPIPDALYRHLHDLLRELHAARLQAHGPPF